MLFIVLPGKSYVNIYIKLNEVHKRILPSHVETK